MVGKMKTTRWRENFYFASVCTEFRKNKTCQEPKSTVADKGHLCCMEMRLCCIEMVCAAQKCDCAAQKCDCAAQKCDCAA